MSFIDIRNCKFSGYESIVFDTNIFWYLFGPLHDKDTNFSVREYSSAYKRMLSVGCRLLMLPIILSEYIKLLENFEYRQFQSNSNLSMDFHQFTKMNEYIDVKTKVYSYLTEIVQCFEPISMSIGGTKEERELLQNYYLSEIPINDILIYKACLQKGLSLVTHDHHFSQFKPEIQVYTANNILLRH